MSEQTAEKRQLHLTGFTRRSLKPFRKIVIWKVLLAMLAALVGYSLLLFPLDTLFSTSNNSQISGIVSDYVGFIIILLVPFLFFVDIEHDGLYAEEIKSKKLLRFFRTILSVILIVFGLMLVVKAFAIFFGQTDAVWSAVSNFVQTTNFDLTENFWLFIVFDVVLGLTAITVLEEILYRAMLIGKLTEWLDLKWSIVVAALIFAVFAPNVIAGFLLGLALGLIYVNSRSLLVVILCHAFYNLIMLILAVLRHTGAYDPRLLVFSNGYLEFFVGLVLLALGALLFYRFLKRYWIKDGTLAL